MTDPFQPLTVRDIPRLTRYFSARGTRLCNDSAGAAVLWQPYFQDAALELDGTLVLREQFPGLGTVFSTPIGENVGNAYDFLAKYCREVGQPLQFFPATDADVENLRARFGVVEVTPVRAWFDYLYDAQDMVSFRGRRFNGQRNHIHRFQRPYPDWSFERVTAQNLPEVCREADVVVVAMGRMGAVGADCLRAGQTVVDVGIHVNEEGKLCGDVQFADAEPVVDAITPVPGGVGTVTTSVLVGHVVQAAAKKAGL